MVMVINYKYYLEVVVRIIVAAICGGTIGFEREKRNNNVGVRTYMTVCLSTAVVMIIAKMCFRDINSGDVTRMAAAAIQGISFLGIAASVGLVFVGHVWIQLIETYKKGKKK